VVQFLYGEDGMDAVRIEGQVRVFERQLHWLALSELWLSGSGAFVEILLSVPRQLQSAWPSYFNVQSCY
jgi:hypothetical protein